MSSNGCHVGDIQKDINRVKPNQTYLFVDRSFQESIIEYFQFLRREGILELTNFLVIVTFWE